MVVLVRLLGYCSSLHKCCEINFLIMLAALLIVLRLTVNAVPMQECYLCVVRHACA